MSQKEDKKKEFRKYKITARKYEGDDCYSWAVFHDGRPVVTGLGRDQVNHYKREILEIVKKRETQQ